MLALALAMDVLVSMHITNSPWWMGWRMLFHAPWWIAFGTVFLVAVVVVEGSAATSIPSMGRYLAGALAASCVCIALSAAFAAWVALPPTRSAAKHGVRISPPMSPALQRNYAIFNMGCEGSFRGLFIMLIYGGWRRSRHAEQQLADAELAHALARRELLASRLAASRDAIDPEGVLAKLGRIEAMYAQDPMGGEALMDRLIEDLREAIPRVRADLRVAAHAA